MKNNILLFFLSLLLFSCKKDKGESLEKLGSGKIILSFSHNVDGSALEKDTMKYMNAAGNPYSVSEVKYFISEVVLHRTGGYVKPITDNNGIHYIDISMPSTLKWVISDSILEGHYDSISFLLGISEIKNKTGLFPNPPESNMVWPDILGGGYHYMMINGKWKDKNNMKMMLHLHLGIGQLYSGTSHSTETITGFVQNYFRTYIPLSSFTLKKDETREIRIVMNIESWFMTPNVFDLNYWGGMIMQNQDAMKTVCENGHDVFTVGF